MWITMWTRAQMPYFIYAVFTLGTSKYLIGHRKYSAPNMVKLRHMISFTYIPK